MTGTRAQVLTLEAVLAALVVLAGLVFALQSVVLTPSTSGASESPVDASQVDSLLAQSTESGALRRAVLDWGAGGFQASPAGRDYYSGSFTPPNDFLRSLQLNFDRTVTYNVLVHYQSPSGGTDTQRMVYNGAPGDGAVRADTVVTIYDSDIDGPSFASDVSTSTDVYNVLEVEVVAWRG